MKRTLSVVGASVLFILGMETAHGAGVFTIKDFSLHNFDDAITGILGYDVASVVYFKELASLTSDQMATRKRYEEVGCNPFYVMKDGNEVETGYNCRSFFCVGYTSGPKLCQDWEGNSFGGVVEINNRTGGAADKTTKKNFSDFPKEDQSSSMKKKMAELAPYKCVPLYLMDYDVVIGEGYSCEQVGSYPYFSSENTCIDNWTVSGGYECDIPTRENEFEIRAVALDLPPPASSSSSSSESSQSSSVSSVVSFPDVLSGKYGYTAIMDLAARGIVRGYADGTFRPNNSINRAEFLTILLVGLHGDEVKDESGCFPDVQVDWYSKYVCAAKRLGWVGGYLDGTFRPDQPIRREEALKIVIASVTPSLESSAILPPDVPADTWYAPYVRKGVEMRIILEALFQPGINATRADSSVWMYRASRIGNEM